MDQTDEGIELTTENVRLVEGDTFFNVILSAAVFLLFQTRSYKGDRCLRR